MINEREIILDALLEILEKKQYSHIVMSAVLDKHEYLPKNQRSFIKRCCEGTIEKLITIDYVINQFSKTKTNKMKPLVRTILRMGTYQILYMDYVPDAAVCNESVKLASKRGFSTLKGFVNGVLRTISRQKETIEYPDKQNDVKSYLSITYSMPEWIVSKWYERYGLDMTEKILEGLLEKRPLLIRVRECISEDEKASMLRKMEDVGIKVTQRDDLPYAYALSGIDRVNTLPGYEEGLFTVQDIGSMQVIEMAGIQENQKILDVCAAPGGKSIHALDKMHGTGSVLARDLSEDKVNIIWENIERCKAENIFAMASDATIFDEKSVDAYDVVIADLPCSGLGVIGRKSDIKYRITQQAVNETALLQREILKTIHSYVKVGGTLMYSTCTITEEENEQNRDWFLKEFPFELIEEKQLLPGIHNSDGFYMVKLIRKA